VDAAPAITSKAANGFQVDTQWPVLGDRYGENRFCGDIIESYFRFSWYRIAFKVTGNSHDEVDAYEYPDRRRFSAKVE
jgi:hypothetical protein